MAGFWRLHHRLFLGAFLTTAPVAAHAQSEGKIALRGVVVAKAAVALAGLADSMAIDLATARNGITAFKLDRFANSNSGFTLRLGSQSVASSGALTLAATDGAGAAVPYKVRYRGRDLQFENGEAELATITRQQLADASGDDFEVVAPPLTTATTAAYADHLVLIVTAR